MLSGEKILVTGPAGQIGLPLCHALAPHNEVWGAARFSDAAARAELEAIGVRTCAVDLAAGDLSAVPSDVTYLVHLAAAISPKVDVDAAMRVNAEATGFLLSHCRGAKAALVMSTNSVYKPNPDPRHPYHEDDPLGEAVIAGLPMYSVSKIAQEGVARYCAREFGIKTVIARMNVAYSARGGLPAYHLDRVMAGEPVVVRHGDAGYSPIHQDDINGQLEALLDAAATPALVVNWCGDDVVGPGEWCELFAQASGRPGTRRVEPVEGSQPGSAGDPTRRRSITGPCTVRFEDGMRRLVAERYPTGAAGGPAGGMADPLA